MVYTEQQINDFCELAQEIGLTRAKRELKYPSSWVTGKKWTQSRGIEVPLDDLKAQAAATREFYKDEEVKVVAQEGFNRVYEELTTNQELSADEQKKLAEATQKYYNVWAAVQGKATSINETRTSDTMDEHLQELLSMERAKNVLHKEQEVTDNNVVS